MARVAPSYLDVVFARVPVRECLDRRPCIVLRFLPQDMIVVAPCSSQWPLFEEARDFRFPTDDANYAAMGFARPSYAIGLPFVKIRVSAIIRRLGQLRGQLADDFLEWARDYPVGGGP